MSKARIASSPAALAWLDAAGVLREMRMSLVTGPAFCDRPVWSPAPMNKIACTCGTDSGYDICLIDMTTRQVIKLTDGVGSNEQPSFAPNGRHLVFTTTRWGKEQIAIVDRRGSDVRQITNTGNNTYPSWQPIR